MLLYLKKSSLFQFLLPLGIFAAIPILLWLMRPRQLVADSAAQLISSAKAQRQEVILEELQTHVSQYNTTNKEIDGRWHTLQHNLINEGTSPQTAAAVIQIAHTRLSGQKWPILAEQGWISSKKVWVIIAGWPEGRASFICPPTFAEMRADDLRRYTHNVDVTIVSAQSPYKVIQESWTG